MMENCCRPAFSKRNVCGLESICRLRGITALAFLLSSPFSKWLEATRALTLADDQASSSSKGRGEHGFGLKSVGLTIWHRISIELSLAFQVWTECKCSLFLCALLSSFVKTIKCLIFLIPKIVALAAQNLFPIQIDFYLISNAQLRLRFPIHQSAHFSQSY